MLYPIELRRRFCYALRSLLCKEVGPSEPLALGVYPEGLHPLPFYPCISRFSSTASLGLVTVLGVASLFTRNDSAFIQIRFRDQSGKWRSKATAYRKENNLDWKQAKALEREQSRRERETRSAPGELWGDWVEKWMLGRYGGKGTTTFDRYHRAWRRLHAWLVEHGVRTPAQLHYRHLTEYFDDRKNDGAGNGVIHDLKFLGVVMGEALRRGYCFANPCIRMGFKRDRVQEKSPWSDADIATVAKAIVGQPHWLRCTFVLGLYQAARLRQIPLISGIDFERRRISYDTVKGGDGKRFTHPMDARAVDSLRTLVAERKKDSKQAKTLCDIPLLASVEWRRFLDTLSLGHLSHHGLRVTWITRAAKAGVPLNQAKRFVNHGSNAVHNIYVRLNADDIDGVTEMLTLPSL